jgi:hypothetical protein
MKTPQGSRLPILRLCFLTVAAVAIHGYHLGVEDAEIYIPAAKKMLHPELYPYASEFFLSHGKLSLFSPILAGSAWLAHLSMDWTVALYYLITIFATLTACWMLATTCFESARARWSSVLLMTAVLTMPATNTGLMLMDPYLTARSFSTPLTLFALDCILRRRYFSCILLTVATLFIHTQMTVYLIILMGILWLFDRVPIKMLSRTMAVTTFAGFGPAGFTLTPAEDPYREALYARDFFFLMNWSWYHWLGMLAPLGFMAWFWKGKLRAVTPEFKRLSLALIPFGIVAILTAALLSSSHVMDMFVRLQPLRCFHLITFIFVLSIGGVVGEYAAKNRPWVLAVIMLPLAIGMFYVNRQTYSYSPHIEWPWLKTSTNPWVNALLWVRENTPTDAVFAVDSRYFKEVGVDVHGFRTLSERAALPDYYKDGGVVAMFPSLAVEWKQMSNATYGLNHFDVQDFQRLAKQYPVQWTLIHGPAPQQMDCPYEENDYTVCRISGRSAPSKTLPTTHSP